MSDDQEIKQQALARTPLFAALPQSDLDQLGQMAKRRQLALGQSLFVKGDPGDTLYVVVSGVVKISMTSPGGSEKVLNLIGPGQMFGEIALLDGGERTADAIAVEPSELVAIGRRDLFDFFDKNPRGWTRMLAACCERIRWISEMFEDATFLELPARLAKRLLLLSQSFGQKGPSGEVLINLRLSQQDLANQMSVTRESINKVLNSWDKQEIIHLQRGRITLLAPSALERIIKADHS